MHSGIGVWLWGHKHVLGLRAHDTNTAMVTAILMDMVTTLVAMVTALVGTANGLLALDTTLVAFVPNCIALVTDGCHCHCISRRETSHHNVGAAVALISPWETWGGGRGR